MPHSSPKRNFCFSRSPQKHAPHFTSKKRKFPSFPSEACPSVHLKETSDSLVPLRSMPLSSPQRNFCFSRSPQKHAPQFTSNKSQFHSFPSDACPSVHLKEKSVSLVPLTEECPSVHLKETPVSLVSLGRMPLSSPKKKVSFPRSPHRSMPLS